MKNYPLKDEPGVCQKSKTTLSRFLLRQRGSVHSSSAFITNSTSTSLEPNHIHVSESDGLIGDVERHATLTISSIRCLHY